MIPRCLLPLALIAAAPAAQQPATIDLHTENAPLLQLVERISRQCDAGLVVDSAAVPSLGKEVTIQARDAKWDQAMDLLANEYGIAVHLVGDRLEITSVDEEQRKRLEVRFYDIRTLTTGVAAYPSPELDIPEPGGEGSRLLPPIEDTAPPELNEVVEIVKARVAPGTWDRAGVAIEDFNGAVVITQTPEVHAEIAALLVELERVAARQVICRAWDLGPGAPSAATLDAEGWRQASAKAGSPIAVFPARDGQQNHHFSGVQRAYIADADVVQTVMDPIAAVVSSGLTVDLVPSVTVGGVLVTTRLSATIAQGQAASVVRDGAGDPEAAIELPSRTIASGRDLRLVPPGGAALYAIGDRTYALTFEVVSAPAPAAPAAEAKPTR
jgi:hypothetical protein